MIEFQYIEAQKTLLFHLTRGQYVALNAHPGSDSQTLESGRELGQFVVRTVDEHRRKHGAIKVKALFLAMGPRAMERAIPA